MATKLTTKLRQVATIGAVWGKDYISDQCPLFLKVPAASTQPKFYRTFEAATTKFRLLRWVHASLQVAKKLPLAIISNAPRRWRTRKRSKRGQVEISFPNRIRVVKTWVYSRRPRMPTSTTRNTRASQTRPRPSLDHSSSTLCLRLRQELLVIRPLRCDRVHVSLFRLSFLTLPKHRHRHSSRSRHRRSKNLLW